MFFCFVKVLIQKVNDLFVVAAKDYGRKMLIPKQQRFPIVEVKDTQDGGLGFVGDLAGMMLCRITWLTPTKT
jgi:hypothetical protein